MKHSDIKLGVTYFAKRDGKTIIVTTEERVSMDGVIRCNHYHGDDVFEIQCRQIKSLASTKDIERYETEWLLSLEVSIATKLKEFMSLGEELRTIRNYKLYEFAIDENMRTSFEEYCFHRMGMSKPQAYRLIDAAEVVANLSPIGDKTELPQNESQCRELKRLPEPKQQQKCWKDLLRKCKRQPTAVEIKDYIEKQEQKNSPHKVAPSTAPIEPRPDDSDADETGTAPVDPRPPDVSVDPDDIATAPVESRPNATPPLRVADDYDDEEEEDDEDYSDEESDNILKREFMQKLLNEANPRKRVEFIEPGTGEIIDIKMTSAQLRKELNVDDESYHVINRTINNMLPTSVSLEADGSLTVELDFISLVVIKGGGNKVSANPGLRHKTGQLPFLWIHRIS